MKLLIGFALGMVVIVVSASALASEASIKIVELKWHDIAQNDGGEMYSNLCASCHGMAGKGNGPAAAELSRGIPDLTMLSSGNGGVFPKQFVAETIYGGSRSITHRNLDMPNWGKQFMYVGRGWHSFPRRNLANERVQALTKHVASLQVN
jgi:hypothetical protein